MFVPKRNRRAARFCSNPCKWASTRRPVLLRKGGYRYVHAPEHPHATKQGYVAEHRLVVEKRLGRFLKPTEVVHHINEVTHDNRDENLQVFASAGQHAALAHGAFNKK
jgi:hypothetical protein